MEFWELRRKFIDFVSAVSLHGGNDAAFNLVLLADPRFRDFLTSFLDVCQAVKVLIHEDESRATADFALVNAYNQTQYGSTGTSLGWDSLKFKCAWEVAYEMQSLGQHYRQNEDGSRSFVNYGNTAVELEQRLGHAVNAIVVKQMHDVRHIGRLDVWVCMGGPRTIRVPFDSTHHLRRWMGAGYWDVSEDLIVLI